MIYRFEVSHFLNHTFVLLQKAVHFSHESTLTPKRTWSDIEWHEVGHQNIHRKEAARKHLNWRQFRRKYYSQTPELYEFTLIIPIRSADEPYHSQRRCAPTDSSCITIDPPPLLFFILLKGWGDIVTFLPLLRAHASPSWLHGVPRGRCFALLSSVSHTRGDRLLCLLLSAINLLWFVFLLPYVQNSLIHFSLS